MSPNISRIIDLSHPISEDMPHWPGDPATRIRATSTVAQDGYFLNELTLGEHSGTHLGAPAHFGGAATVDKIQAADLIAPAVKIDVSGRADRDYLLSPRDIHLWQEEHGELPHGCVALVQTGWSRRWPGADYLGAEDDGLHFPGVSVDAAALLLREHGIRGLGIDTAGVDGGASTAFAVNTLLAARNVWHLENLANLEQAPARDFYVFVGALKIKKGGGSPCRVFAFQVK